MEWKQGFYFYFTFETRAEFEFALIKHIMIKVNVTRNCDFSLTKQVYSSVFVTIDTSKGPPNKVVCFISGQRKPLQENRYWPTVRRRPFLHARNENISGLCIMKFTPRKRYRLSKTWPTITKNWTIFSEINSLFLQLLFLFRWYLVIFPDVLSSILPLSSVYICHSVSLFCMLACLQPIFLPVFVADFFPMCPFAVHYSLYVQLYYLLHIYIYLFLFKNVMVKTGSRGVLKAFETLAVWIANARYQTA